MKTRSLLLRLTLCFTFTFAFAVMSFAQSNEGNSTQEETEEVQKEENVPASFSKAAEDKQNTETQETPNGSSETTKLEERKVELENMLKEMDPSSKQYSAVKKKLEHLEELLENQ